MAEADLLKAVVERPDDDAPRLAYAQAMDAESNPRGAFIRMQIALARMGKPTRRPESFLLRNESMKLRQQFGQQWAGPVAAMVQDYSFHRGFVEAVTMPAKAFLENAAQLFWNAPVQHIDFTEARPVFRDLLASPYLLYLRSVAFNQAGLFDADIEVLARSTALRNVRWLSLFSNNIAEGGVRALAASSNLPSLRYVNLGGNPTNPVRQFRFDQGVVSDSWLPESGERLERQFGPIAWLRPEAETSDDVPPDRFLMART